MRAGAQLIIIDICHADRNRKNSNRLLKRRGLSEPNYWLGLKIDLKKLLRTVNVNPARKVKAPARIPDSLKR